MRVPTLISYWKQVNDEEKEWHDVVLRYGELVKLNEETPILPHFVACDKNGKPLEKPSADMNMRAMNDRKEFQEAESRVRWVGVQKEIYSENGSFRITIGDKLIVYYKSLPDYYVWIHKTYESIITSNIPLYATEGWGKELKLK